MSYVLITIVGVAVTWGIYFALHSLLASERVKGWVLRRWPAAGRRYRLAYNLAALALLPLPVLVTGAMRGAFLWSWPGTLGLLADGAAMLAAVGFLATLFSYDLGVFSELKATVVAAGKEVPEALSISLLHRFVRHPWYFFVLVILWTRDMDLSRLVFTAVTTVYLVVGSRLEEGRLIDLHGERYRSYRRAVAALVPLPWRTLSAAEARELEAH